jgi:hypothetical protein
MRTFGLEPLGSHANRSWIRQKGEDSSWWSTCNRTGDVPEKVGWHCITQGYMCMPLLERFANLDTFCCVFCASLHHAFDHLP